jgi:hypothetical protein
VDKYAKAIAGAIVAGLTAYQVALTGDGSVTAAEWAGVAIAVVAALGAVWAVTNAPAKP